MYIIDNVAILRGYTRLVVIALVLALTTACSEPMPPDTRPIPKPINSENLLSSDVNSGKQYYDEYCLTCHKMQLGDDSKAPHLYNIVNSPAALLDDYEYSSALESADIRWNITNLDAYIQDPNATVPHTKMLFDGIDSSSIRQDIIAYLVTLSETSPK